MSMKIARSIFYPAVILCMSAALPAVAIAGKDSRKPQEATANTNATCKQSVRAMSESTPVRKGECAKVRRILM